MDCSQVFTIGRGYLMTPVRRELIEKLFNTYDTHDDHSCGWTEYVIEDTQLDEPVIPTILSRMASQGLAFIWEYALTTHDSYFAYNFPTEDSKDNFKIFKTNGRRRGCPKFSKKKRLEYEKTSAANELLLKLGIEHGTN